MLHVGSPMASLTLIEAPPVPPQMRSATADLLAGCRQVLAVAALGQQGELAPYSNFGATVAIAVVIIAAAATGQHLGGEQQRAGVQEDTTFHDRTSVLAGTGPAPCLLRVAFS